MPAPTSMPPHDSPYMRIQTQYCCVYKFLLCDTCTPDCCTSRWVFVEIMLKLQFSFVLQHLHCFLDVGMSCMQLWPLWQLGTSDSSLSGSCVGISVARGFWPCNHSMACNYFSARSESEFLTKRIKSTNTISPPSERHALKGESSIWWAHIYMHWFCQAFQNLPVSKFSLVLGWRTTLVPKSRGLHAVTLWMGQASWYACHLKTGPSQPL